MAPHQSINDIAERRKSIDKALRDGGMSSKELTEGFAYVYKDGATLGMGRSGAFAKEDSNDEYSTFIVTTLDADRDGDVVVPMGWYGKNYEAARGPWFFGHQEWKIAIGNSMSPDGKLCVFPEENRVVQRLYWDKADADAMFLKGKYDRGVMNSVSIAFVPIVARKREEMHKAHRNEQNPTGYEFLEWDHTETSCVGVPANPGANQILRDSLDREKSFITPRLQKCLGAYAAQAKSCWNGWCPTCPPAQETKVMTKQAAKHFCGCPTKLCGCAVKKGIPRPAGAKVQVVGSSYIGSYTQNSDGGWVNDAQPKSMPLPDDTIQRWINEGKAQKKSLARTKARDADYNMTYLGRDSGLYGEYCRIVELKPNQNNHDLDRAIIELDDGSKYEVLRNAVKPGRKSYTHTKDAIMQPPFATDRKADGWWVINGRGVAVSGPFADHAQAERERGVFAERGKGTRAKGFRPQVGSRVVVVITHGDEDIIQAEGVVTRINGQWAEIREDNGRKDEWPVSQLDDFRAWKSLGRGKMKTTKDTVRANEGGYKVVQFYDGETKYKAVSPSGKTLDEFESLSVAESYARRMATGNFKALSEKGMRTKMWIATIKFPDGHTTEVEGDTELQARKRGEEFARSSAWTEPGKVVQVTQKALSESSGTAGGYTVPVQCECGAPMEETAKGVECMACGSSQPLGKGMARKALTVEGNDKDGYFVIDTDTGARESQKKPTKFQAIAEMDKIAARQRAAAMSGKSLSKRYRYKLNGRSVRKYITHDGDTWTVHAESGKVIGTHDTKESAENQLRAVEANKHKSSKGKTMRRKSESADDIENDGTHDVAKDESQPLEMPKHSAQVMAALHSHLAKGGEYLDGELSKMDNPVAAEALTKFKDETLSPAMEGMKAMFGEHHCSEGQDADEEMAKCVKSMETSGPGLLETGEANEVDQGNVPPEFLDDEEKAEDNSDKPLSWHWEHCPGCPICEHLSRDADTFEKANEMDLEEDATHDKSEVGSPEWAAEEAQEPEHKSDMDDPDNDEILERYQHPHSLRWLNRKATAARVAKVLRAGGTVRQTKDGRKFLVVKAGGNQVSISDPKAAGIARDYGIALERRQDGMLYLVDGLGDKEGPYRTQQEVTQYLYSTTSKSLHNRRKDLTKFYLMNREGKYSSAQGNGWTFGKGPAANFATEAEAREEAEFMGLKPCDYKIVKQLLRKDLTDEGNPSELVPGPVPSEAVKAMACALKGMAVAHDMPEHHKDALMMHGEAVEENPTPEVLSKAVKHMKAMGDAPDVPEHHKDALDHHAGEMEKELTDHGSMDGAGTELTNEGNPAELKDLEEDGTHDKDLEEDATHDKDLTDEGNDEELKPGTKRAKASATIGQYKIDEGNDGWQVFDASGKKVASGMSSMEDAKKWAMEHKSNKQQRVPGPIAYRFQRLMEGNAKASKILQKLANGKK